MNYYEAYMPIRPAAVVCDPDFPVMSPKLLQRTTGNLI
jgi:hypothetical protein